MKTSTILLFFGLSIFFMACHKTSFVPDEQLNPDEAYGFAGKSVANYDGKDTQCIPLNEMGARRYYGYVGGFYPRGMNVPFGKYAADLDSINRTVTGLDTFGIPRPRGGQIVIAAVGACLSGAPIMGMRLRQGDSGTIENTNYVNFEFGGTSYDKIAEPNSGFWGHVATKIVEQHATYRQVQLAWIVSEDSTTVTDFPDRALIAKENLKNAIRTLKIKFPNLKILYFLGRPYTWDSTYLHTGGEGKIKNLRSRNPAPYHQGWAEKWVLEDQINGDPGLNYKGPNAVAPILTWGSYQWTYKTRPNLDGFQWKPHDTTDGLHPNDKGKDKLAQYLWNFFYHDPYTSIWFRK